MSCFWPQLCLYLWQLWVRSIFHKQKLLFSGTAPAEKLLWRTKSRMQLWWVSPNCWRCRTHACKSRIKGVLESGWKIVWPSNGGVLSLLLSILPTSSSLKRAPKSRTEIPQKLARSPSWHWVCLRYGCSNQKAHKIAGTQPEPLWPQGLSSLLWLESFWIGLERPVIS